MLNKWLIIGISGVTCGGKTTLSTELNRIIPNCTLISQDDYFLGVEDSRHKWIPELNHINFDTVTSLDMEKMYADVLATIKTTENIIKLSSGTLEETDLIKCESENDLQLQLFRKIEELNIKVLIIEGFCIFQHIGIIDICCLKYFVTLTREECFKRRLVRVYEPPDCIGYFEKCVWPEYLMLLADMETNTKDISYIDGSLPLPTKRALLDILRIIKNYVAIK